ESEISGIEIIEPVLPAEGTPEVPPVPVEPVEPAVNDPTAIVSAVAEGKPVWVTLQTDDALLLRLKIADRTIQDLEVRTKPKEGLDASWTVLNPMEPLIVTFKIAGYGGLFLAMPFVLYQLCAFIFPG